MCLLAKVRIDRMHTTRGRRRSRRGPLLEVERSAAFGGEERIVPAWRVRGAERPQSVESVKSLVQGAKQMQP